MRRKRKEKKQLKTKIKETHTRWAKKLYKKEEEYEKMMVKRHGEVGRVKKGDKSGWKSNRKEECKMRKEKMQRTVD